MRKHLLLFFLLPVFMFAQTDKYEFISFWEGTDSTITLEKLASLCAPIFWYSPDEPELHNRKGKDIKIPTYFPFDTPCDSPVVYYQFRNILHAPNSQNAIIMDSLKEKIKIDLSKVFGFDIDYNHYYRFEAGLGGHDHDTEQAQFKIHVNSKLDKATGKKIFTLYLLQAIGKAHALMWYDNIYNIDTARLDYELKLPFHILVEEGKHASITDMNGDGYYTPGYDVNVRTNDAWGLRDVIRTGELFSPEFKSWMAKVRQKTHRVFPPLPDDSKWKKRYMIDGIYAPENAIYKLCPMPSYKEAKDDILLSKDMSGYYEDNWPTKKEVSSATKFYDWWEAENFIHSLAVSFRMNDVSGISFAFPLLIVRNVEAPLVGGWLVNRLYLQDKNLRDIGYGIMYTSSASRFLDGYFSVGVEFDKYKVAGEEELQMNTDFVFETGIKLRGNVSYSPLKFLSFLTKFWGVRLGIKNKGFMKINELEYVFEIGAGVW